MKLLGQGLTRFGKRVYWTSLGCGMAPSIGVEIILRLVGAPALILAIAPWLVGVTIGTLISKSVFYRMTSGDRADFALTESEIEDAN
jgi:hypothetical protein